MTVQTIKYQSEQRGIFEDLWHFSGQLNRVLTQKYFSFSKGDFGLIRNTRQLRNQHKCVQVKTSYDRGYLKGI